MNYNIFFLLHFIRSITSSGTCATDSFYEKCIDEGNINSEFSNNLLSNTKTFWFRSTGAVPFHNTSCLLSYHLTVNNFSDANYFNSRNRANELLQFDLSYHIYGDYKCHRQIIIDNYLLSTQQQFNVYLTKLIRYFLKKLIN